MAGSHSQERPTKRAWSVLNVPVMRALFPLYLLALLVAVALAAPKKPSIASQFILYASDHRSPEDC